MTPRERLTPKEIQISILVWQGLTNREIGRIVGTSEQVIKNHWLGESTRSVSGAVWSWRCTWPATAERIGPRRPSTQACLTARQSAPISRLTASLRPSYFGSLPLSY